MAWSQLKRKIIWTPLAVVLVILGGWMLFGRGGTTVLATTPVTRGTVMSQVSVTGTVKPEQSLDLGFVRGGRLTRIAAHVGDTVRAGDVLAVLDNADLYAQLAQTQAQVEAQQAQLSQLLAGATAQNVEVSQVAVTAAQQTLTNAYGAVINALSDAYAKSDDAVRKETDGLFVNDETATPQLTISVTDTQVGDRVVLASDTPMGKNVQAQRVVASNELNTWSTQLHTLQDGTPTHAQLDSALTDAIAHVVAVRSFMNAVSDLLNNAAGLSQATLDGYKTGVNLGRTNVNMAATALNGQQQTIAAAQAGLQSAQAALNLKTASATPDQIAAQQALVDQAKAQVAYNQAQIANTVLRAPFSGTVTKIIDSVGDIVQANTPAISVIGSGAFEIETYVAESDIAKIKPGQDASVTLDAYGSDVVFQAKVLNRDLSQTMLDGVATYKTTLQFAKEDPQILPGLTANIDILSAQKDNVLFVSTRDIIDTNGNKFVLMLADNKGSTTKQVPITVGLRGSDGRTEIISGLSEGDRVVSE